ncbi:MAG: hypothetical protein F4Y18_05670 [Cenarchaeum sp. SB0663_bin_5]|nr:hypothetical protein [Cenarchaeum sp. SB0663_bin_5]MYH04333.1 hypothetical protein [Cenarchaeum sp. SB0675_bin_21]MYL10737.1 hypothetical protein [Cenarchaeum sp. SB0669_bin_11]
MKKTYIVLAISAVALIPVSVFAVDQTDIEIAAKQQLDEIIKQLEDDTDKATAQEEIKRLEKLLAGAYDLKDVVTLSEQAVAATGDDKIRLEAELSAKMVDLDEHAGDRYHHTEITEVEQSGDGSDDDPLSTQSAWPPQAYSSNDLTDFEF